ncbi:MAG: multidrug efflux system membrane fusion protein [Candidatus Azotimanducaceae bacterium]|jgi:multidrug efflux system membrane fusion protein
MKTKHILPLALPLLALLAACSKADDSAAQQAPQALPVQVAHPLKKSVIEYTDFTGRLEAVEMVDVKPRVSGYIESIHFREGQKVKKGDLLFIIDPRPFQAQVNRFKAQVNQAESALALANSNLKRSQKLIETRAISQEEADIRENEALQAEADLAAAQAELEAVALDLDFTKVTAPIDGIADRHFVTAGNLVTGDVSSLTTLVPHDPIYAYYEVDERTFLLGVRRFFDGKSPVRGGNTANIPAYLGLDHEEGHPHEGVINFASNQLNPNTATITVRALFENDDEFLTPGLFARIRVPISKEKERILIPDTAIGSDQSIKYVWVVTPENTPERRRLELGAKHEGYRIVHSGLTTEDRVVVNGIQFIRPSAILDPQEVEI